MDSSRLGAHQHDYSTGHRTGSTACVIAHNAKIRCGRIRYRKMGKCCSGTEDPRLDNRRQGICTGSLRTLPPEVCQIVGCLVAVDLGLPMGQCTARSWFEVSQNETLSEDAELIRARRVPDGFAISSPALMYSWWAAIAKKLIGEGGVLFFALRSKVLAVKIKMTQKLTMICKSPREHGSTVFVVTYISIWHPEFCGARGLRRGAPAC
jgi:hypothetical protein